VDRGEEVLRRLDELAAQAAQRSAEPAQPAQPLESEATAPPQTVEERLAALDTQLNQALAEKNEGEIRRIAEEARALARAEMASREQSLQEAQDYFNEALKEYGESGEETKKSAREVANWKRSLEEYDDFVKKNDEFFDPEVLLAHLHDTDQPTAAAAPEHAPAVEPAVEPAEPAATLEQLLAKLDEAANLYTNLLEGIRSKKKNIAAQIAQERIAKLKQSIGA